MTLFFKLEERFSTNTNLYNVVYMKWVSFSRVRRLVKIFKVVRVHDLRIYILNSLEKTFF